MKIIKDLDNCIIEKNTAITIGKFDALHLGHRLLVENICNYGKNNDCISLVIVFDRSPRHTLNKDDEKGFVITKKEREEMLDKLGVDVLLELVFDENLIHTEAEDFIKLLKSSFKMAYLAVGEDFRFGYKGIGDIHLLSDLSKKLDYTFESIPKLRVRNEIISSSRIRQLIGLGDITTANELLGYEFFVTGKVVHGKQLGRKLNFPTVNIVLSKDKIKVKFGVYATKTEIDGKVYYGIANVGNRPTVNSDMESVVVEMYIFDFVGDLYEKDLNIFFVNFLRSEKRFENIEMLKNRIEKDVLKAKKYFSLH